MELSKLDKNPTLVLSCLSPMGAQGAACCQEARRVLGSTGDLALSLEGTNKYLKAIVRIN